MHLDARCVCVCITYVHELISISGGDAPGDLLGREKSERPHADDPVVNVRRVER